MKGETEGKRRKKSEEAKKKGTANKAANQTAKDARLNAAEKERDLPG